jgi:hypothetical protein
MAISSSSSRYATGPLAQALRDARAHPIFRRDVPDNVWRPGPNLLTDVRLAGFLRSTGEHDLERLAG